MRHLIELFLKMSQTQSTESDEESFSLSLDCTVIQCYAQATAEKEKQRRTHVWLRNRLAADLTQALSYVDLRDFSAYCAFMQTVQRWCPWQREAQEPGQCIRQILLELLPAIRKKQQLDNLCRDYKNHLTTVIEMELKSDYPIIYAEYQKAEPWVFGAPPCKGGKQRLLSINTHIVTHRLDRFVTEQAMHLQKPSVELTTAIQKYRAVRTLEATLQTPIHSAKMQLTHFSRQFSTQQSIIAKDRDSLAVKFVKGIATILSLGLAGLLGIWGVRGQAAANDMSHVLSTAAGARTA